MGSCEEHTLTLDTLNPNVIELQYAVRGPVVIRATEIENELASGVKKPFNKVVKANIGDCHATGQRPMTYIRQVLALCTYPELMNSPDFPADTKERAKKILEECKGHSLGSYSDSCGISLIRKHVAQYIEARDNYPSDPNDIVLSTGASDAIKSVMTLLLTGKGGSDRAGFMIPIPQYPLYSAATAEFGAYPIPYYLNEKNNWSLGISELERAINESRDKCKPRAIVIINPGNPTGAVLTKENIQGIIKFAKQEKLFILADEVYQHNVYAEGAKFFSFKQVLMELGAPYSQMELASFMSASKGFMGECGYRGGYAEVINLLPEVRAQYYKSISAKLCPPISGQVVIDCIVNPPKQGDPSYSLFIKEKEFVLEKLKEKAELITKLFNSIEGISCNQVMGAMYAFPRIYLPDKAIKAAEASGQSPDAFYCFALLEETGICTVPGSGFREEPGTYHFRTTILPQVEELKEVLTKFESFHLNFISKYS
ncbi:alanine aminotransferase 2-like [Physella acuta]|uniref:alanine aminotransferase 2-like n=1 Tax=Physella acuta TaxID=109671 RepID=UPI0027DDF57F|nr:alanine aminotransferase 2-like [Physella acuta]XP_059161360.1 alanine aminotransferase 2-like [Physella acuta]XP_059161361.1 alanine aminotransferase 2-like [Physella acuta]XP_059161362.1 alanine aminotransferase 2-like [Physella acuta]